MTDMRQQQAERYRAPSFEEAVDIADEVRQWRRDRRKVIAMRVVAALLIIQVRAPGANTLHSDVLKPSL